MSAVLWSVTTIVVMPAFPQRGCEVGELVLPWEVLDLECVRAPFQAPVVGGEGLHRALRERVREIGLLTFVEDFDAVPVVRLDHGFAVLSRMAFAVL
jgi:hypothetical protein